MTISNAVSDAPKGKGGSAETVRPIQENAMLSVVERPAEGKAKKPIDPKYITVSESQKAALWLNDQVEKAGKNVVSIVADITPQIAAVLLERNPANRKLKAGAVQDYSHDMKNGAWKFNGEPIIIAQDGLLNDGQHRCAAIIESGQTIKAVLVFGVERDTRDTLDQGSNRTSGDYLAIHGHAQTNHLAAVAKAVWQWRTYGYLSTAGSQRPTRSEVLQTVNDNPGIVKSFSFVNRPNAHSFGSISSLGFAHFAFNSVAGHIAADYFMDALVDGTNLTAGDPILICRNRLIIDRKSLRIPDRAELLFRAWNAHRLGQTRVSFRITGAELPLLEA